MRKKFNIEKKEPCCDILCKIRLRNFSEEFFLIEDKGRKGKRGKHLKNAIDQLISTSTAVEKKGILVNKHIIANCKIANERKQVYGAKIIADIHPNVKILCSKLNKNKPIYIRKNKPIYWI